MFTNYKSVVMAVWPEDGPAMCTITFNFKLKALYHVIRADYLIIIEAAFAHMVNDQWAWWMANKFTCTFKPAC